jgi:hypothetical protein
LPHTARERGEEKRKEKKGKRGKIEDTKPPPPFRTSKTEAAPDFLFSTNGLHGMTTVLHCFNLPPHRHPATTSLS